MTNITNANSTYGIITAINSSSGSLFGIALLILVFIIALIGLVKTYDDTKRALLVSITLTTVVATLEFGLKWISWEVWTTCISILVTMLIIYFLRDR